MANVTLKNVYKVFNEVIAVNNFSMEINDKEFIVFVGPSGCGKTTTLRMIAGLENITHGEIYIGDKLVNFIDPKERNIAMVFQNYALYPHMTVYNNLAFSLKQRKFPIESYGIDKESIQKNQQKIRLLKRDLKKVTDQTSLLATSLTKRITILENENRSLLTTPKSMIVHRKYTKEEINEKVYQAARLLEIEPYLLRRPKALSGGQRQRVAIGRAIVRNPKVFLMDEPLSNLDAKLRNQMRAELILLRKRINTTFIYVTHDQTEAMTLGDRIVIMKDGFVQQIGTSDDVFYRPTNLFVAGFIGTPQMNFFEASLINDHQVLIEGVTIAVPPSISKKIKTLQVKPQPMMIGIRPEHLKLCQANDTHAIRGKVVVVESMGSMIHLHVTIGNTKDIVIIVPTMDILKIQSTPFVSGQDIFVHFDVELAHLFSKETEKNLLLG